MSVRSSIRYLRQDEAKNLDLELLNKFKFNPDQLMEIYGFSCAAAISKCYSVNNFSTKSILICCGPGNTGGDGLVCARHLRMFGYKPVIYYPNRPEYELYQNYTTQCLKMNITFISGLPDNNVLRRDYCLIVDAVFGITYKSPVQPLYLPVIALMQNTKLPIASIDVPSGWDIDKNDAEGGIKPDLLISIAAPKHCAVNFTGRHHYLVGRFIPPALERKYKLNLPEFPGTDTCVSLTK